MGIGVQLGFLTDIPFERIHHFVIPTDFGPKSPIGSKIDVKGFQKQLYKSIPSLIRNKKY